MIRIALCGALGRMGKTITEAISQHDDLELGAAIESPGHPELDTQIQNIKVESDLLPVVSYSDVVVDFSTPTGAVNHAKIASDHLKPFVTGVTAFTEDQETTLKELSAGIPIVKAPNMSVGVNLLYQLVNDAARILGDDFDIEVIEAHHRYKKDAPSGTAVRLADILSAKRSDPNIIHGRHGMTGERPSNEIAIHALRGGDIIGEHTVVFAGLGERVEITHRAHSRMTFANGVIRSIRFIIEKPAGLYTMNDVLGLK